MVPWQSRPVKPGSHSHLQEEKFRRPCPPQLMRQGFTGTSDNRQCCWINNWVLHTLFLYHSMLYICILAHHIVHLYGPTVESNRTWRKCRERMKAQPCRVPPADLSPPSYPCSKQRRRKHQIDRVYVNVCECGILAGGLTVWLPREISADKHFPEFSFSGTQLTGAAHLTGRGPHQLQKKVRTSLMDPAAAFGPGGLLVIPAYNVGRWRCLCISHSDKGNLSPPQTRLL